MLPILFCTTTSDGSPCFPVSLLYIPNNTPLFYTPQPCSSTRSPQTSKRRAWLGSSTTELREVRRSSPEPHTPKWRIILTWYLFRRVHWHGDRWRGRSARHARPRIRHTASIPQMICVRGLFLISALLSIHVPDVICAAEPNPNAMTTAHETAKPNHC